MSMGKERPTEIGRGRSDPKEWDGEGTTNKNERGRHDQQCEQGRNDCLHRSKKVRPTILTGQERPITQLEEVATINTNEEGVTNNITQGRSDR